jgi:hypothetical protein
MAVLGSAMAKLEADTSKFTRGFAEAAKTVLDFTSKGN